MLRPGRQRRPPRRTGRRRRRRDQDDLQPQFTTYTSSDAPVPEGEVIIERGVSAQEFAPKLNRTAADVVRFLLNNGEMVTATQSLTDDMIEPPGPRILFVNRAFTDLTGYRADEILGARPRVLQPDHGLLEQHVVGGEDRVGGDEHRPVRIDGGGRLALAGGNAIQVTLTATNGTLNLSGTKGLTFTPPADGTADASMTFTGALTDINAALEGATFVATPGFSGSASVQIVTDDQGNTGTGGALSDSDTVSITVKPPDSALWLTTATDETNSGAPGLNSWTGGEVLQFGGSLTLEPGTTNGTFSAVFNLDDPAFSDEDTIVNALHTVGSDITVGTNSLQLYAGDILLSTQAAENLARNVPNPFNPATEISFDLPRDTDIELAVFDLAGRRVRTLEAGPKGAGTHTATWRGTDDRGRRVASGVYVVRLSTSRATITEKITFIR